MHRRKADGKHPARNGAAPGEIRNGHDVRWRRARRRRHIREIIGRPMATAAARLPKTKGCAFLLEERTPEEVFTPEDLTEEHRAIARAADEFWNKEVTPNLDEIVHGNHDLAVQVLKKS